MSLKVGVTRDLGQYLDEVVYPALFSRMDSAFPEFGWRQGRGGWTATTWPPGFPESVDHENPERLMVYANRPYWIKLHGRAGVRLLDYVNGGRRPSGDEFPRAVRRLCELASVPFPERELTPEATARVQAREARRSVLEAVIEHAQAALWSPAGDEARAYLLRERGFKEEEVRELGLGYYDSVANVRETLRARGYDVEAAKEAALLWEKLEGYITIPWHDATGAPLTIYGRWKTKAAPEGRPKTIALPGEGSKGSPLYFDRARRAGRRDLVAVEGVFDAALLQARGEARAVAYVAAQLSRLQVETLVRFNVASVVLVPDPDGGGDKGAESSVNALLRVGIPVYVAPRLPDGLDPDEFLLREGIDGWRAHVAGAVPGSVFMVRRILAGHELTAPQDRDAGLDEAFSFVESLGGPREQREAIEELTELTGIPPESLEEELEASRARRRAVVTRKKVLSLAERLKENPDPVTRRAVEEELSSLRLEQERDSLPTLRPVGDQIEEQKRNEDERPEGELLGYRLRAFAGIARDLDGIQSGLYLVGAETNVGKTAFLTNLFLDLVESNPGAEGIYFSFDDNKAVIVNRLVALMAGLELNAVKKPRYLSPEDRTRREAAYARLVTLTREGRADLRDLTELTTIQGVEAYVKGKLATPGKRLFVVVDGLHDVEVGGDHGGLREEHIARAQGIKTIVETYGLPVIATTELRKRNAAERKASPRPSHHDIMETGKYGFKANLIWILHPADPKAFFEDGESVAVLELIYSKNKLSPKRGISRLTFTRYFGRLAEEVEPSSFGLGRSSR